MSCDGDVSTLLNIGGVDGSRHELISPATTPKASRSEGGRPRKNAVGDITATLISPRRISITTNGQRVAPPPYPSLPKPAVVSGKHPSSEVRR